MSSQERALRVAQQQIGNQRMVKAMINSELVTLRAENERLKAIVDAIPDKDDPLGWVQDIEQTILEMRVAQRMANETLKTWGDAIPGDDKLAVAEWAVTIAAEELLLRDACPNHDEGFTTAVLTCPPSVRAALRSVWGES